jgi:seryl-tRNA synthetase
MNLIISKNNNDNLDNKDNKIVYDFIVIMMIIVISTLLLFDYLITMIEMKEEVKSIKKYIESLTNIENFNYKETRTKISLIMDNVLNFQEEQDKNIEIIETLQKELYNKEDQYIIIENKFNNKTDEYQKQIEEIRKELKAKDEQYKNIENKFNKLSEEFNNKNIEHQKQVKENKKLAINIYYYWKSAHNIHPGLISMYDIIDGIYKHFYDTTFNTETNNFSHEILEETIPFLIKRKQQQLLDNAIFR